MAEVASAPGPRRPWREWHTRLLDVALVSALLLPVLVFPLTPTTELTVVLSATQIAPLFLRRLRPMLCFALVSAAMVVQVIVNDVPIWGQVAMPVAVYSVAAFTDRVRARIALAVGLAGALVGPWDWLGADVVARSTVNVLLAFLLTSLLVIAPWALGTLARTRRAYVAALVDRGHRLEREAAQQAELAASDERARIAREMHDVVAHGLSVMVVQADGARYAVPNQPEAAASALETIAATGRESLAEMRRMLGLLRSDDAFLGTRPQPGLADLDFLFEQSTATGMQLSSDIAHRLPDVAPGTGLTVYRIVQEALTNVRKHAGPDVRVKVRIGPVDQDLVVEVVDDGRGATAPSDGRGHGLIGMRERVAVHGGRLEAGPPPGGGFRVWARVPLDLTGEP